LDRERLGSRCRDAGSQLVQPVTPARDEADRRAGACERERRRFADSRARPSDEGDGRIQPFGSHAHVFARKQRRETSLRE